MEVQEHRTTAEWEAAIGSQFRAARLDAGLDQVQLAALADLSPTTVSNLETGRGSSLATIIRIARALDRTDWLQSFNPPPAVSPMDLLRGQRHERQRVYRPRTPRA